MSVLELSGSLQKQGISEYWNAHLLYFHITTFLLPFKIFYIFSQFIVQFNVLFATVGLLTTIKHTVLLLNTYDRLP